MRLVVFRVDSTQRTQLGYAAVVGTQAIRRTALAGALLVASFSVPSCGGGDNPAEANSKVRHGKVRVVYHDDEVKPENRQAVAVIRKSRVFEQLADWVNKSVALPQDLVVHVTDKVPPGVMDAVTQPDGRTIYMTASFLTQMEEVNRKVVETVKRPALYPEHKFNADDLSALSIQFIFGHEIGHALQRHLQLPNIGLEEDAADGFASFYTVNELGPDPSMAAAILFDEIARTEGALTLEGLSSDHPVTQQRVFNFLCLLEGSDPKRYDGPLVSTGYLPKTRAPLCPQAWAALDYGWWTQLKPHFRETFRAEGTKTQEAARKKLIAETKAFAEKLDEFRSGGQ
ncbi:MAG TPA: DUF4344 domain-containing metallopeptidase [Nitrospira sp.]|nr:DUF4344 domain-containing metallopeptidase [Nitrospira sp.]